MSFRTITTDIKDIYSLVEKVRLLNTKVPVFKKVFGFLYIQFRVCGDTIGYNFHLDGNSLDLKAFEDKIQSKYGLINRVVYLDSPELFYQTKGSAGVDLMYNGTEPVHLEHGKIEKFSTGISLSLVDGYEAQVRSRSSLASKGILVANSPGTIDSDYKGEVYVTLYNMSGNTFVLVPGQGKRIAQLVLAPVERFSNVRCKNRARNNLGFGSTDD